MVSSVIRSSSSDVLPCRSPAHSTTLVIPAFTMVLRIALSTSPLRLAGNTRPARARTSSAIAEVAESADAPTLMQRPMGRRAIGRRATRRRMASWPMHRRGRWLQHRRGTRQDREHHQPSRRRATPTRYSVRGVIAAASCASCGSMSSRPRTRSTRKATGVTSPARPGGDRPGAAVGRAGGSALECP